jgi:hypothetical protein
VPVVLHLGIIVFGRPGGLWVKMLCLCSGRVAQRKEEWIRPPSKKVSFSPSPDTEQRDGSDE